MSGRVVHFEVPFDDADRAREFYREVFGWQIQPMPEMDYNMVQTGPVSDQGMPSEPGYIGGGMMQRQAPYTSPVLTVEVDDIDAAIVAIEKHGGAAVGREDGGRGHGLRRLLHRQRGQRAGALAERRLATTRPVRGNRPVRADSERQNGAKPQVLTPPCHAAQHECQGVAAAGAATAGPTDPASDRRAAVRAGFSRTDTSPSRACAAGRPGPPRHRPRRGPARGR